MLSPAELASEVYRNSNLTQHQLLIWLGQKLMPDVPLYNATLTFTFSGKIDPERFRGAFRRLVAASDTLRTVIEEVDGAPQQRTAEAFSDLEYLDWSNLDDAEKLCREKLRERCRKPFDFSRRLFDAALIKLGAEKYVWYLNQHHIISDGTSFLLAYRHMAELYARAGTDDFHLELPRFRDYVAEELERERSAAFANAAAYWQKELAEPSALFEPYGARNRRAPRVERFSTTMGVERTAKLKALAAREEICRASGHAAVFSLLAAALYAYMYRTSGSRSISVGVPFHNRASTPFREVLGLVMKVIPVRITVERGDSFLSVIAKIQREMAEIRPYRNIALPNPPGARAYDVWLNYITAVYPAFCGLPVHVEWLHPGHERDAMALQVYDFDGAENFVLDFDCHRSVFDADEQREVMRHYLKLLDALLENPSTRIDDISLLDDTDRRLVLEDWNASTWRPSGEQTFSLLFEASARRNPDAIALRFENETMTYARLNAEANRLARHLRSLGAGPETIVALAVEPSPEMLVGILGILKAGAAYLPLDPEYPRERLSYMLSDARTALLVTEKKLSDVYPHLDGLDAPAVVYMDRDRETIAACADTDLAEGPRPRSLAYVIYTSGSTGPPKGVMIEHAAVCNRLQWGVEAYGLNETDRVLQKASFAFDASVWEIFEPLIAGAQIVMAKPRGRIDVEYLIQLMAVHEVTVAEFSPSLLRALLDNEKLTACRALKRVFSGGEVLTAELERKFFAQSRAELYNTYGPTETSIDVTHWKCGGESRDSIPIGRPVAGMRVYIVDDRLEPVPIGMPGELCIGGIGVARGYLNAPELTAAKFVRDPFSGEAGARLYKTGDLARHRRDGALEFLGRKDDQVKIRGFRVEPGEVEAALAAHPEIRQAAVVARENGRGAKQLAAYVVAADGAASEQEVRRFLRERLPEYMMPRSFTFLDALPLTPSGKVDRRALPSPERDAHPAAPPIETVESRLTEIWESLLGARDIGIEESFFDLGGDSLRVVELMQHIEQAFGERLPLSTFLAGPTIRHLGEALVKQRIAPDRSLMVCVQPGDGRPPFFYLHGDFFNGGGFYTINMARYVGADRPFYTLAPHGLNGTAIPPTIEAMADDYIEMMRSVQPRGPYYLGGFCSGAVVAYEMARRLERQGERVALVVVVAAPARTAFYHRALRALVGSAGGLLRLAAKQRVDLALRLRAAGLTIRRLYRRLRGARITPRENKLAARIDPIFIDYAHALTAYAPKEYGGRVLCLWPEADTSNLRHPTAGWGRVARQLEFQPIPGAHGNCVKYHLRTIAERIRDGLLRAEAAESGAPVRKRSSTTQ